MIMQIDNMKKFLKSFKKWKYLLFSSLLGLIFVNEAQAQGIQLPSPLCGLQLTPGEIFFGLLPLIGMTLLFFVVAPILGLILYRKRGGKKKWPLIIAWILGIISILIIIFALALSVAVFLLLRDPGLS